MVNMCAITSIKCEIICNKFNVVGTKSCVMCSPSADCNCIRYRITNLNRLWPFGKSSNHAITYSNMPLLTNLFNNILSQ